MFHRAGDAVGLPVGAAVQAADRLEPGIQPDAEPGGKCRRPGFQAAKLFDASALKRFVKALTVAQARRDPEGGIDIAQHAAAVGGFAQDKFDKLAEKFDKVIAVGTKSDLYSHGNPTWITTPWNWPEHVEFFSGTLRECAFLVSKCKAFIGNDGGLSHVAAATGIKTFVLFGPSSDIKNKPYTKDTYVVAIDLPCRPCQFVAGPDGKQIFAHNKADCPNNMKCMKDMSVDYVYSKVKNVIGE